jgi:ribosomal protein L32
LPDAVFCAECGHRVESAETVEQETDAVEGETVPEPADTPESAELAVEAVDELSPATNDVRESEEMIESEVETAVPDTNSCPSCGAPVLPDAIFCLECGHQIGA